MKIVNRILEYKTESTYESVDKAKKKFASQIKQANDILNYLKLSIEQNLGDDEESKMLKKLRSDMQAVVKDHISKIKKMV